MTVDDFTLLAGAMTGAAVAELTPIPEVGPVPEVAAAPRVSGRDPVRVPAPRATGTGTAPLPALADGVVRADRLLAFGGYDRRWSH
ncbi:hypothetical protein KPP03845_106564 [Streptomyces xanthophaeus]|uniref:hypothetical protein n=1 Tax=Streptomyces xanthophaeus TaxID=67385 RepID=UPI00233F3004|nr:hypothetical protein [Streptomyces xanthophaeus]WCD90139.1 hypothetical protein KPP03845_106564 [Streptomyces xanthophaeus]